MQESYNPSPFRFASALASGLLSSALLASSLIASSVFASGGPTVIYSDATGADVAFRLSRDGSTVLRSYFPTAKSPLQNDVWTVATGLVTLPNPGGIPWVASSLNGDGTIIGGQTNPSGSTTPNAGVIYDSTTAAFVEGTSAYSSCVVAPSPTGGPKFGTPRFRAFLGKPVTGIDYYRPALGFVPHSSQYDGAELSVGAADVESDRCAGFSVTLTGGELRTRPFLSVEGAAALQLPLYSPDTDGEVLFFANSVSALLMKTWHTLPDGSRRARLVRWENEIDYEIAELSGGAVDLTVYGVDDGLNTVVFNALTPAGAPSPLTVWTRDDGFMTANDFLIARGTFPGFSAGAIGISGDGLSLLTVLENNTIVLYQGLIEPQCGGNASCYLPHQTPGCSNETCCETVCAMDPYCCDVQWDTLCANRALVLCRSGATCAEAKLIEYSIGEGLVIDTQTASGDDVETSCGADDTKATWRILRPTCTGVVRLSLCNENFFTEQGVITVYDDCGGAVVACVGTNSCLAPRTVAVEFWARAGEDYLVRFSAENGGSIIAATPDITCTEVCGTGGPCTLEHDSRGCNNGACCETVCNIDPYCCTNRWDAVCVEEATRFCFDPADINRDGTVDAADLALVLSGWGSTGQSDINGDGTTDAADLALVLANWG